MPRWRNFQKKKQTYKWPKRGEPGYRQVLNAPPAPGCTRVYIRVSARDAPRLFESLERNPLDYWMIREYNVRTERVQEYLNTYTASREGSEVWSLTPFTEENLPVIFRE